MASASSSSADPPPSQAPATPTAAPDRDDAAANSSSSSSSSSSSGGGGPSGLSGTQGQWESWTESDEWHDPEDADGEWSEPEEQGFEAPGPARGGAHTSGACSASHSPHAHTPAAAAMAPQHADPADSRVLSPPSTARCFDSDSDSEDETSGSAMQSAAAPSAFYSDSDDDEPTHNSLPAVSRSSLPPRAAAPPAAFPSAWSEVDAGASSDASLDEERGGPERAARIARMHERKQQTTSSKMDNAGERFRKHAAEAYSSGHKSAGFGTGEQTRGTDAEVVPLPGTLHSLYLSPVDNERSALQPLLLSHPLLARSLECDWVTLQPFLLSAALVLQFTSSRADVLDLHQQLLRLGQFQVGPASVQIMQPQRWSIELTALLPPHTTASALKEAIVERCSAIPREMGSSDFAIEVKLRGFNEATVRMRGEAIVASEQALALGCVELLHAPMAPSQPRPAAQNEVGPENAWAQLGVDDDGSDVDECPLVFLFREVSCLYFDRLPAGCTSLALASLLQSGRVLPGSIHEGAIVRTLLLADHCAVVILNTSKLDEAQRIAIKQLQPASHVRVAGAGAEDHRDALNFRSARVWNDVQSRVLVRVEGGGLRPQEGAGNPVAALVDLLCGHQLFAQTVQSSEVDGPMILLTMKHDASGEKALKQVQRNSHAPLLLGGHSFRLRVWGAMGSGDGSAPPGGRLEFDDEWYRLAASQRPSVDRYDAADTVWQRGWNAELWRSWFARYDVDPAYNVERHRMRVAVMLSTMAVCRRQEYVGPDQRNHRIDHSRLLTSQYQHATRWQAARGPPPSGGPPCEVRVLNQDSFVCAKDLLDRGLRPLVLNMASATSRGGGYRKGDGAQEENLFRRSNYYLSLDTLDESVHRRIPPVYPMDEFGAVHTRGVTVFRGEEADGYPFLAEPFTVDCVALAAYRNPPLTPNRLLVDRYMVGTRRKLETLFRLAVDHGHDALVLSALGCGAFHNPPHVIAQIFAELLLEWSPYFRHVVFAIVDDHNAKHGNFKRFERILHASSFQQALLRRSQPTAIFHSIVSELQPCSAGGGCTEGADPSHGARFSHPPLCVDKQCPAFGPQPAGGVGGLSPPELAIHRVLYRHHQDCMHGALCNQANDAEHCRFFTHPPPCKHAGACTDFSEPHLCQFTHVALCRYGKSCNALAAGDRSHVALFRHAPVPCKFSTYCRDFADPLHVSTFSHPFVVPCTFTPYCSAERNVDHCTRFAHVCPYGTQCKQQYDDEHLRSYIHVPRPRCDKHKGRAGGGGGRGRTAGSHCSSHDDEHYECFSHARLKDIRDLCSKGAACPDRALLSHMQRFRHPSLRVPVCHGNQANHKLSVDFRSNTKRMTEDLERYFGCSPLRKHIPSEVLHWVRTLRPVHRCKVDILRSVLLHGELIALSFMTDLKSADKATHSVLQQVRVQAIERRYHAQGGHVVTQFVRAIVWRCFIKHGSAKVDQKRADQMHKNVIASTKVLAAAHRRQLEAIATEIAEASLQLASAPTGIQYKVDLALGTNNHVFSILGYNTGNYGDAIIHLKPEVMFHPDFNVTPMAGTSFHSGRNADSRPWCTGKSSGVDQFHRNKLHPSRSGWDVVLAGEICAKAKLMGLIPSLSAATVATVERAWFGVDSHQVFESHLPNSIPMTLVDKIIVPAGIYAALSAREKKALHAALPGDKHVVVGPDSTPGVHGPYWDWSMKHARLKHAHSHDGLVVALSAKAHCRQAMPLLLQFPSDAARRDAKIQHKEVPVPMPRGAHNQAMTASLNSSVAVQAAAVSRLPGLHAYFRAKGHRFSVVFSADDKSDKLVCISFLNGVSARDSCAAISLQEPRALKPAVKGAPANRNQPLAASNALTTASWFHRSCPSGLGVDRFEFVSYHIAFVVAGGVGHVVVEHAESSGLLNTQRMYATVPASLVKSLRVLSLVRHDYQHVAFKHLSIAQKRQHDKHPAASCTDDIAKRIQRKKHFDDRAKAEQKKKDAQGHGEEGVEDAGAAVPPRSRAAPAPSSAASAEASLSGAASDPRVPCRWGRGCRDWLAKRSGASDKQIAHCKQYSHHPPRRGEGEQAAQAPNGSRMEGQGQHAVRPSTARPTTFTASSSASSGLETAPAHFPADDSSSSNSPPALRSSRPSCRDGSACVSQTSLSGLRDSTHRERFAHPGESFRLRDGEGLELCEFNPCKHYDDEHHLTQFKHKPRRSQQAGSNGAGDGGRGRGGHNGRGRR